MSDSSAFDGQEPRSPYSGQETSDTTLGSLESIPPWPGPPAEQYAPGPASQQPGVARSDVAGQQWPAVAGRLPPPQRTESTPAAALATAERGGNENPDRSAPLPVAENPMLQLLIKHMDQTENMQKMMQDMMKNMVSQRAPPAILLPSGPPAPLPALAASSPRPPPPLLPAERSWLRPAVTQRWAASRCPRKVHGQRRAQRHLAVTP